MVNRVLDRNGLVLAESVGNDLRYIFDWSGHFLFYKDGEGVVIYQETGKWETLFPSSIEYADYFQCFENNLIIFGCDASDRAFCDIFDLTSRSKTGEFSFAHRAGCVSEVSIYNKSLYFLWGNGIFRFNGELVEQLLPTRAIGGYYITVEGICVLFADTGMMCFYDHDLLQERAEVDAPLPGYAFNCFNSRGGRLAGYLGSAQSGRLRYGVLLPISDHRCPVLELEPPLFQVDRRERGQAFDLLVRFSGGESFPTLLRHTLAALTDGFSQFESVLDNPDATCFSGRIELHFVGLFTDEEKDLLLHGCQRVCALTFGREAPATGESFNFRLVFAE